MDTGSLIAVGGPDKPGQDDLMLQGRRTYLSAKIARIFSATNT
jgi:hypothetical protein